MDESKNKKLLVTVLILAAVLRLATVFVFFHDYSPASDAADWHQAAQNLLAGNGLLYEKGLRAYRTPIPTLYFAAIYSVFGISIRAAQIANVFLGVLTVWLLYDFLRRSFGPRPALWAALVISCNPLLLFYTGQLLSETPVIMLLSLSLWLVWVVRDRTAFWFAPAGVALGLAVLTRESMLPVATLIAIWTVVARWRSPWPRRLAPASIMLASLVLTLTPWTVRNYSLFGSFVPLTSKAGLSLWIANNPLADGTGVEKVLHLPAVSALPEAERGAAYQKVAMQFIREDPQRFVRLSLRRLTYFLHLGYHGEGVAEIAFLAIYFPMLVLAVAGIWIGARADLNATLLLLTVPLSMTVMHMVFFPEGRYRLPSDVVMCSFAANAISWLSSTFSGSIQFLVRRGFTPGRLSKHTPGLAE